MKVLAVSAASVLSALLDPSGALAVVKGAKEGLPLRLPAQQPQQLSTAGSGGGSLVRTFVGLAVVVAAIYGLYWVLRQVKRSREERASGHGLHTEAVVPLGPNRSLHLVRAGRELVLVGVAEQGVVPIRTYTEEEALAVGLLGGGDDDDGPDGDVPGAGPSGPGGLIAALTGRRAPARTGGAPFNARVLMETLRERTVRG